MAVAKKTCVDIAQKVVVATKGGENKTCVEIAQKVAATQEAKKDTWPNCAEGCGDQGARQQRNVLKFRKGCGDRGRGAKRIEATQ